MKNIFIKIIFLTALAGLIIYLDLTGFNQKINLEYYRNILSGTGYARPFIYIGICIIAPNLMFPFAVVIMTGGIVFGCVKGMILTLIGGFLSTIAGYYIARFLGRETIRAYFLAKRLRKKAGKFDEIRIVMNLRNLSN